MKTSPDAIACFVVAALIIGVVFVLSLGLHRKPIRPLPVTAD